MRRILFTLLAAGAMLAAVPAASIAVGGDHHQGDRHREREHRREHRAGHHRHHDHHARIRHEHFVGIAGNPARGAAGTITSFAGGRLTIRLNDGSSVSGAVRRVTEIECEMRGDRNDRGDDGPGHDAGDDHGQGGDDHGHGADDRGHGRHDGDRERHRCGAIMSGTTVRDATLTVTRFGAVWTRIDLIGS